MTTPAFVSAGPRIHSAAPLATNLFDAGRTYTSISGATHANFSSITSGHLVAVLTGANAGIWSANGTTTLTFVHDWSTVVDGDILTADQWYVDQGGTSAGFTPPHSFEWASGAWGLVALDTWPSDLEIPTIAAPAGVATGDRVLLVFNSYVASASFWDLTGGLDDWDYIGRRTLAESSVSHTVRVFTRRWAPGCLPVTVEPQSAGGSPLSPGSPYFYDAQIFAFRPSHGQGVDVDGSTAASSGDTTLDSAAITTAVGPGIAVAIAAQPAGTTSKPLGTFLSGSDYGYTEIHRTDPRESVWPAWRGGDLAIATRDIDVSEYGNAIFGPIWVHESGSGTAPGVSLLFSLQIPDSSTAGLGWNGLHMNGGGLR